MDMRMVCACIALSLALWTVPSLAQTTPVPPETMPPAEALNATAGLSLPADFTVAGDQGFVEVVADSPGEVRFAVLGTVPVKYKVLPKTVIVATPHAGGTVVILAVALVNGQLTDFARCTITITPAGPSPGPAPPPPQPPTPTAIVGKIYVTVCTDAPSQTPAQAAVVNSQALRQLVQQRGALRVVDKTDPWLARVKLDTFLGQAGGFPVLLVQDATGAVRLAQRLPETEAAALALIRQLQGGGQ